MSLRSSRLRRQHPHDRPQQTRRQRPRHDRLQSERHHLVALFRAHGGEPRDHDAERAEIGEAAHGVEHDQP
jgi:hypothetical protein